jgi:hypothetical protein
MRSDDTGGHEVRWSRRELLAFGVAVAGGLAVGRDSLAGPVTIDQFGDQIQTLRRGELPDFAKAGGPAVEEAYRFALEQGKDLEYIPCFCGCRNIGHRGNRDCYVKSENPDGTVTYSSHSAG